MAIIFDGATDRVMREHNLFAWNAWHAAAFMRTKRMPELKRFLAQRKRKPQTPEEQEIVVRMMHAALTGETRH